MLDVRDCTLSVSTRVAEYDVSESGLKDADTEQLFPAARELGQVVVTTPKKEGLVPPIENATLSGPLPVFKRVKFVELTVVLIATFPNGYDAGVRLIAGAVPVPPKATT
jgi:hypothetical protein